MLNGAQDNNKRGVLSVYKFIESQWKFFKDIYLDDGEDEKCFMVECPNYLEIDGKEFIISCLEQDKLIKDGGHFVEIWE